MSPSCPLRSSKAARTSGGTATVSRMSGMGIESKASISDMMPTLKADSAMARCCGRTRSIISSISLPRVVAICSKGESSCTWAPGVAYSKICSQRCN